LREVIATETQARVTDVTRLEAKTDQNAAQVTQLTQALADETQARATAVTQLTAHDSSGKTGRRIPLPSHWIRLSPARQRYCIPFRRTVRENG
jgi:hypothetical protein